MGGRFLNFVAGFFDIPAEAFGGTARRGRSCHQKQGRSGCNCEKADGRLSGILTVRLCDEYWIHGKTRFASAAPFPQKFASLSF